MQNLNDFIERMSADQEFAAQVNAACQAKMNAGGQTPQEGLISVAKEYGYEFSEEELKAAAKDSVTELNEEEMGKVAGGTWAAFIGITVLVASGVISGVRVLGDENF